MWTAENRPRYDRGHLRDPSDVTDEEWSLIAPMIPPARHGGRKRTVDIREVVNGLMYVLSTGCQWRAVPKDRPPRSTLHRYFGLWRYEGVIDKIHDTLYVQCRERAGKEAGPTACMIDSQSVKSAEKGGPRSTRRATMRARRSKVRTLPNLSAPNGLRLVDLPPYNPQLQPTKTLWTLVDEPVVNTVVPNLDTPLYAIDSVAKNRKPFTVATEQAREA